MATTNDSQARNNPVEIRADEATSTPFKRPTATPRDRARAILAALHQQVPADIPEGQGRRRADRLIPAATLINTPRPDVQLEDAS